MRFAMALVLGLFLTATLAGCGGATIPEAPADAKPGPPPGSSAEWLKTNKKAFPNARPGN